MSNKKTKTPLQEAVSAYKAVRNAQQNLEQKEKVLERKTTGLSMTDAVEYEKMTSAFDKSYADNLERIEKMRNKTHDTPTDEPTHVQTDNQPAEIQSPNQT